MRNPLAFKKPYQAPPPPSPTSHLVDPAPPDPLRAVLLRAAADVLLAVEGASSAEPPPPVRLDNEVWEVRVEVRRKSPQEAAPGPHLTRLDLLILAQAPDEPATMDRLARLCGHDSDSYFQARVRRLAELGLLLHDFHGYRRA